MSRISYVSLIFLSFLLSCLLAFAFPLAIADSRWAVVGEDWRANPTSDNSRVNFRGNTPDGTIMLRGGCSPRPGFSAALHGYEGDALQRIDDHAEPVTFEVVSHNQGIEAFPLRMHYFAPERAWVMTDRLFDDFLQSFASGDLLQIRSGSGLLIAEFRLGGAREVYELMRSVCQL